jgi:hypothetical protein
VTNIKTKTALILMKKTIKTIRPIKDKLSIKTPGIYCVQCECGKVSVQHTGRNIGIHHKKYMRHVFLGQLEESALAECLMDAGYFIKFSNTYRMNIATSCVDHWMKKAIEVLLYVNNSSMEGGGGGGLLIKSSLSTCE